MSKWKFENSYLKGMIIGIVIGTAGALITDKIALWIPIGLAIGGLLGLTFSKNEEKKD